MEKIEIFKPTKCHLWNYQLTKDILINSVENFKIYLNDYHNSRSIKKCKDCNQLYFVEFYEEIDFIGGEDKEYHVYIPVISMEIGDKLNKLSRFELAGFTGIYMNFPPYNSNPYLLNQ